MEGCLSTIMEGCPSKKLLISCKACRELIASGGSIWASVEQEGIVGHSISAQRRVPLWTIFDPELSTGLTEAASGLQWGLRLFLPTPLSFLLTSYRCQTCITGWRLSLSTPDLTLIFLSTEITLNTSPTLLCLSVCFPEDPANKTTKELFPHTGSTNPVLRVIHQPAFAHALS